MQYALKLLTESDLRFFADYYEKQSKKGKQKAINLNKDIFVDVFYPHIEDYKRMYINVSIFGPCNKAEHRVSESKTITKSTNNWRLNGLVSSPTNDIGRYKKLLSGKDLVLMVFKGNDRPKEIKLFLISQENDANLHQELEKLLTAAQSRMIAVTADQLIRISHAALGYHSLRQLFFDDPCFAETVQDAARGDDEAVRYLQTFGFEHGLNPGNFKQIQCKIKEIGCAGEVLVNKLLERCSREGKISRMRWASKQDPTSPFDFEMFEEGHCVRIDVKSTADKFDRAFYMSMAELKEAADDGHDYDIYRVYGISSEGARLRVAMNVRKFALCMISTLNAFPPGVRPVSFSIRPDSKLPDGTKAFEWDEQSL